jgi:hypothetical protein
MVLPLPANTVSRPDAKVEEQPRKSARDRARARRQ